MAFLGFGQDILSCLVYSVLYPVSLIRKEIFLQKIKLISHRNLVLTVLHFLLRRTNGMT